ncbi:probable pseudouridine-5'-phosphatase isoform X2 [Harmonia axyridis]|uniref:probable pseudouridine-5'-phosphatase isoform X2 n=1 Tax=Harmonia axyridis TaxID=115357 RepID=UPI001E277E99|nr:probable pseudouridine-5'-phosphatase isoform X2 [Harmonia axyridis]
MSMRSKPLKCITNVIFDMDGLLLDTEIHYEKAFENIMKRYDMTFRKEYQLKILGCDGDTISKYFVDHLGLPCTHEEFQSQKDAEMDRLSQHCSVMPGAQKLVEHLHKQKIPIAVATSSGQQSFDLKTKDHKEFFKLFDHIVLGSSDPEVKKGKPAPDIFLVCASRFPNKPKPEDCLVFEDSPNGIQGANAAGMQTVMVPDPNLDKEMTKEATMVLKSLEEFKPELFGLPAF